ncbi:MAG: 7-cyano-7-deazaguanine synthase QueC [candidate division FCPU426 bacterium]
MTPDIEHRAVVLLSGGLDSAVCLALARRDGLAAYALTVDYGQRHSLEIERARKQAAAQGAAEHKIVRVDLRAIGGSALTSDQEVPAGRERVEPGAPAPATYVPARNTILLSLGLAWAEVLRAEALYIGANALDYSGYPDCRPEYLAAFQHLARLATQAGTSEHWQVKLEAPLVNLSKADIVRLGRGLQVDFSLTSSCYNPGADSRPCGRCESCLLRAKGFGEAGVQDPLRR